MRTIFGVWVAAIFLFLAGCEKPVFFPESSMATVAKAFGAVGAYDTNRDAQADFFTFAGADGRINRIAYDERGDGRPGTVIDLDAIPFDRCRHLAIILDGFGYEVVKGYYDSGGLRFCHPPSRVICPYPAMTDPAIEDLLGYMPAPACEAMYYDRTKGRQAGGAMDYLAGKNMPYNHLLQYRAGELSDALGYLWPRGVFRGEVNDLKRLFDKRQTQEVLAYFVSSAGLGTRFGKEGQLEALRQVDRLVNQIVWETRGLVKVTLTADHGHSYTPSTRIPLEKALVAKGWRLTDRLKDKKDAVYIRFGLETYAAFYTDSSPALAEDLIRTDGVELASYPDGDAVVVLGGKDPNHPDANSIGMAFVRRKAGRYSYQVETGDPLRLKGILPGLHADAEGYYEPNEMLSATVEHYYPAPLERLWRAHFALVEHPPDVIVSLEDRFYSGSTSFGGAVSIASTHGGLNVRNCTAFVMSSAGALPPFMRSRDVPASMKAMTGADFPLRK